MKSKIWELLLADIKNEYGVAGLMGNLQAESGLYPDRVQGDIPYSNYSKEYTTKVDSGEISEYDFVHNGPNGGGYGLAQWTYPSRKQGLYDMKKSEGYSSIGSVELACQYLLYELRNTYLEVYATLKYATSIRQASDKVLHDFENPKEQGESVEVLRCELGTTIYNELSGGDIPDTPDEPDIPDTPINLYKKKKHYKFHLFKKRRIL